MTETERLTAEHTQLEADLKRIASTRGTTFEDAHAVCVKLGDNERASARLAWEESGR
jgi:hypothetical protein